MIQGKKGNPAHRHKAYLVKRHSNAFILKNLKGKLPNTFVIKERYRY